MGPRCESTVGRRLGAAAALLALTACAPAVAEQPGVPVAAVVATAAPGEPGGPAAAPGARVAGGPTPAARSARRISAPDFGGLATAAVARMAGDAGVAVRVMAFDEDATVTAQDPPPGTPLPAGGTVVLWLGTPPRPVAPPPPAVVAVPPAPAPPPAAEPATDPVVAAAEETAVRMPPPEPAASPDELPASDVVPSPIAAPGVSIRDREPAPVGLVLTGRASWYGEELAGSPVACGGRFDPAAATLASRELRCGTRVRITGPAGASAEAVVTDWGPAEWTGKRFDLSRAVFEQLAPASRGWLDVRVEVIGG